MIVVQLLALKPLWFLFQCIGQRAVTQLIKSAAIGAVVTTATFWPYLFGECADVRRIQAFELHIMVLEKLPDRASVGAALV